MTVRLREAEAQAELREVKLKALQLESQVTDLPQPYECANTSYPYLTHKCPSAAEPDPQQADWP